MFAEYISDNSWANRSHRGWTALASFAAQALAVAGLLALPLFYTQALPRLALLGTVIAPATARSRRCKSCPEHPGDQL